MNLYKITPKGDESISFKNEISINISKISTHEYMELSNDEKTILTEVGVALSIEDKTMGVKSIKLDIEREFPINDNDACLNLLGLSLSGIRGLIISYLREGKLKDIL